MKILSVFLIISFIVTGCTKSPEIDEQNIASPFEKFLGTWKLDKEIFDGNEVNVGTQIMIIQEDLNAIDNYATGNYQFLEHNINSTITLELTNNDQEIIINRGSFFLICTYSFTDESTLVLDDSSEDHAHFLTWAK